MNQPKGKKDKLNYHDLTHSTLGIEVAVATLLGAFAGWWLDGRYGTTPWFLLAGIMLGSIIGWVDVAVQVREMNLRDQKDREEASRDSSTDDD
jgi:F0F1-type ATP synthase assembly protein I